MPRAESLVPREVSAPGAGLVPDDTIVALATAPGRSALALIRVSGPDAHQVAGRVLRPWPLPERVSRLTTMVDPETGEVVDRPLVTAFGGGRSFTGEPSVEIATHGGYAAPAAALAALIRAGAREALPGEFTRRAVLNGKLDLVQAEAVGDLVDAPSGAMRRVALAQLDGGLSRRVQALREALLALEALLAYDVDFPDEDDGPVPRARVSAAAEEVLGAIRQLLATAPAGEVVREGATVVIAGPPNAGKSSLFNALLGRARALVTSVPGTTRDAIEAVIDAGRWPLRLVDTAGLRETSDVVERLGIEVSERYLAAAHVVLACGADERELGGAVARVRALSEAPVLAVRTKADLDPGRGGPPPTTTMPPNDAVGITPAPPIGPESRAGGAAGRAGAGGAGHPHARASALGAGPEGALPEGALPARVIAVSAERGSGLRELLDAVVELLDANHGAPAPDAPVVTRARHVRALREAHDELAQFCELWQLGALPATVAAVHLRSAVHALEELVGSVDVEDVLERVFSTFCVGK